MQIMLVDVSFTVLTMWFKPNNISEKVRLVLFAFTFLTVFPRKKNEWIINNREISVMEIIGIFELTTYCLNLSDNKWKHTYVDCLKTLQFFI